MFKVFFLQRAYHFLKTQNTSHKLFIHQYLNKLATKICSCNTRNRAVMTLYENIRSNIKLGGKLPEPFSVTKGLMFSNSIHLIQGIFELDIESLMTQVQKLGYTTWHRKTPSHLILPMIKLWQKMKMM